MHTDYHTEQKDKILNVFLRNPDRQMSVKDIVNDLENTNQKVGLATIYRQLEELEIKGKIKKFNSEEGNKSTWQFIDGTQDCSYHYHLKCEKCGKVQHLDCDFVKKIDLHILNEHGFNMDRAKTFFYGICKECSVNNK